MKERKLTKQERERIYYWENRDARLLYQAEYQKSDKAKQSLKNHYQKNKEKIKAQAKAYYLRNREKILERKRLQRLELKKEQENRNTKDNVTCINNG